MAKSKSKRIKVEHVEPLTINTEEINSKLNVEREDLLRVEETPLTIIQKIDYAEETIIAPRNEEETPIVQENNKVEEPLDTPINEEEVPVLITGIPTIIDMPTENNIDNEVEEKIEEIDDINKIQEIETTEVEEETIIAVEETEEIDDTEAIVDEDKHNDINLWAVTALATLALICMGLILLF